MRVIGTAGHVDHGKSTLVQAMTGTHPDRLKEEQEREMTIDLGFAWLPLAPEDRLPDADEIGIVDVPGHRDFIENMLAGVGGIDAALFVVAADEGVMPQTREHLAILDLLQIPAGVVAMTKIDMVTDPEWIDLVEEDLRQVLSGTVLAQAPIVRVSGRTGAGVPELIDRLQEVLAERPPRPDHGRPRLPVDRVFTMAGFGTVVTGTLTDGALQVGDELMVYPQGLRGRVRGLQNHQRKVEKAEPGGRTAVNLSGVTVDQIQRGDVLAYPGTCRPTRRLDVQFRMLPDISHPLLHDTEVKLFLGSAEAMARVRLLGRKILSPGESGWLQLELKEAVVAVRGDRYILRRPSPGETLGGGVVMDPLPARRHRRFSQAVLGRLESLAQGSPRDILLEAALGASGLPLSQLAERAHLESDVLVSALEEVLGDGALIALEPGALRPDSDTMVIARQNWETLTRELIQRVDGFHGSFPLRAGMPKEELRSRMKLSGRLFTAALGKLASAGLLREAGPLVARPEHEIRFSPAQQRQIDSLMARFAQAPYGPPSTKESVAAVGDAVFSALLDLGRLIPVSPEVVFRKEDYADLISAVEKLLADQGTLTVAQFRDRFQTSRRYALAFLEHLDEIGLTVREEDVRRLARP